MAESSSQPPSPSDPHPPHDAAALDVLPDPLEIMPLRRCAHGGTFNVSIRPPGSKSLTNRALLLAALAGGDSILAHPLIEADDTERMIRAISQLGVRVGRHPGELRITGVAGRWRAPPGGIALDLNNAGTATRFLAAAAILADQPITIDGNARMRQRPIGALIDSLQVLGARGEYLGAHGHPPVRIIPPPALDRGKRLKIPTTHSSQFTSALLLIAPWLPGGLTLEMEGEITSRSYVQMTLGLLDVVGATVKASQDLRIIRIAPGSGGGIAPFRYEVEPDASSATYFWGAAALFDGACARVEGLTSASLQPDARFPELLERMGANVAGNDDRPSITVRGPARLEPVMADMSLMPDATMTLAAVACFAEGPSILRGLRTLRHKETDRIAALKSELTKIGVHVETEVLGDPDALTITPPPGGLPTERDARRVEFDTYDDHRMAMSLALIGLRRPNTFIRDPGCVAKTYPGFWRDLGRLYG
jgi:3-phosphoshikimate 1-carboxyvinyltransferase